MRSVSTKFLYNICFLFSLSLMAGCISQINYDVSNEKTRIVINSLLTTKSEIQKVYVRKSVLSGNNSTTISIPVTDGNCLFEAVIKAEKELKNENRALNKAELESNIATLRKQVAEGLLKNYHEIESGTAFHQPEGHKGEAAKLTQMDDPIWVRFKAEFEANNKHQLQEALAFLPDGALKTQALQLKIEHDNHLAQEVRSTTRSKFKL